MSGDDERNPGADHVIEEGRATFDPSPYMRTLRTRGGGSQDYLDVRHRLLWLRREHPDAEISTEHIRIDDDMAIFRASVRIPGGGSATGHGSETRNDFSDFIEKAETKALGRALNALGYGAQFAEDDEPATGRTAPAVPQSTPKPAAPQSPPGQPATPVATPPTPPLATAPPAQPSSGAQQPATPAAPIQRPAQVTPEPPPRPAQPPAQAPEVTPAQSPAPAAPQRPTTPAPPAPSAQAPAAQPPTGDIPLEDVSWTAFWKWARPLGYSGKLEVEAKLGRRIDGMTPGDVRQALLAAGASGKD